MVRLSLVVILVSLATLCCVLTCVGAEFPYGAVVRGQRAAVRSGPGTPFYVTDYLKQGQQVEVYRHDADGWVAIRPPHGSFSWVASSDVERTTNPRVVRVVTDDAATRVGSMLSDSHNVEYVHLEKGEVLELLGSARLGKSSRLWYQVAPPAGEFRWVHKEALGSLDDSLATSSMPGASRESPDATPRQTKPLTRDPSHSTRANHQVAGSKPKAKPSAADSNQVVVSDFSATQGSEETVDRASQPANMLTEPIVVAATDESEPPAADDQRLDTSAAEPASGAWVVKSTEPPATIDTSTEHPADAAREAVSKVVLAAYEEVVGPNESHELEPGDRSANDESFSRELEDVNLQFSRIVAQDVSSWELRPLRLRLERIIDQATRAEDREQARGILRRISQFDAVQQRFQSLTEMQRPETTRQLALPDFRALASTGSVQQASYDSERHASGDVRPHAIDTTGAVRTDPNYDATGWLMPVVTTRRDLPRYALTDSNGRITRFVSPAAGLNLRRFLRQRIGIFGQTGYVSRLKKPHLTAERVVVLERHPHR